VVSRPSRSNPNLPIVEAVTRVEDDGSILLMVENNSSMILSIGPNTCIAELDFTSTTHGWEGEDLTIYHVESPVFEDWPENSLTPKFVARLPKAVQIDSRKLDPKFTIPYSLSLEQEGKKDESLGVFYIHDKDERKQFLDGIGVELPTPPSFEPWDLKEAPNTQEWLDNVDHSHLRDD